MDIKAMAQAAGFDVHPRKGEIRSALDFCGNDITATVEKFARLVAEAEREACAKVCEEPAQLAAPYSDLDGWLAGADWCAKAIRMRSNGIELRGEPRSGESSD